jgi:hypothetical protein
MPVTLSREFYIPTRSMKVADKASDAVAYVYTNGQGRPCAAVFIGKQAKPLWRYSFRTPENREKSVRQAFDDRRAAVARKARNRAEWNAKGSGLVKGDILVSTWGYEQTNVDFYEVTEAKPGARMVTIRRVRAHAVETLSMQYDAVPQSGDYIGEPMRKAARDGRVSISSYASASKWNTHTVAGVPVGPKVQGTSYA